jgi:uncharacterized protein (TIGR02284 family)
MAERTERAVLNHLIETCTDAARGFRFAANHVHSAALKKAFVEAAAEREAFAADLLPHAQRLGGAAAADGTTIAAMHRGWIDLIAKLRHDDSAFITEATRGDDITLHAFKEATENMLPPATRDLVEQQYADIGAAHARIVVLAATEAPRA